MHVYLKEIANIFEQNCFVESLVENLELIFYRLSHRSQSVISNYIPALYKLASSRSPP